MDLHEFVRESLTQIVQGVSAASEAVRTAGGMINPSLEKSVVLDKAQLIGQLHTGQAVFLVEFDVAVTAASATAGGAAAGLQVVSFFEAKVGGKTQSTTESVSRIRFPVPLALPMDPESVRLAAEKGEADRRALQGALQARQNYYRGG